MEPEITVTRALSEVKGLTKKITDKIQKLNIVDLYTNTGKNTLRAGVSREDFEKNAKADYQQIKDLIQRRNDLKRRIIYSNSTVKVTIAGKEYTIAEAIDRKNSIDIDMQLLQELKQCYNLMYETQVRKNNEVEKVIDHQIAQLYSSKERITDDAYNNVAKPYRDTKGVHMIDPINVKKEIEKLEEEINSFIQEVDFVLSESNARTFI